METQILIQDQPEIVDSENEIRVIMERPNVIRGNEYPQNYQPNRKQPNVQFADNPASEDSIAVQSNPKK